MNKQEKINLVHLTGRVCEIDDIISGNEYDFTIDGRHWVGGVL